MVPFNRTRIAEVRHCFFNVRLLKETSVVVGGLPAFEQPEKVEYVHAVALFASRRDHGIGAVCEGLNDGARRPRAERRQEGRVLLLPLGAPEETRENGGTSGGALRSMAGRCTGDRRIGNNADRVMNFVHGGVSERVEHLGFFFPLSSLPSSIL